MRRRIVAKGYTEKMEDEDSVYGSVHDATNTSRTTNVTTKLDRATRRRLYGISTRTHRKGPRRQTTRRLPLARTLSTTEQTMAAKESHVGKLQWLAHTRPDIAYATKEPARYASCTALNTTNSPQSQQQHSEQTPTTSSISTFMSMPVGQDVLLPGNQLQVSTSSFLEQQLHLAAERRLQ